jgi:hypothetical protein
MNTINRIINSFDRAANEALRMGYFSVVVQDEYSPGRLESEFYVKEDDPLPGCTLNIYKSFFSWAFFQRPGFSAILLDDGSNSPTMRYDVTAPYEGVEKVVVDSVRKEGFGAEPWPEKNDIFNRDDGEKKDIVQILFGFLIR